MGDIDSIGTLSLPDKRPEVRDFEKRFITKEHTLLPGFWRQLYATFSVSLAAFSTGNVLGWMGPMALLLPEPKSQVKGVSQALLNDLLSVMQISSIINMMACGYMMDSSGRRAGCWFLTLFAPAGWVFLAMAQTTNDLFIGGLMVGTTMVAGLVVGIVFITEVTNEKLRGPFLSIIVIFHSCGVLSSHILGELLNYKVFNLCCLGVSMLFPFFFHPLPESPMFLVLRSRVAEAKASLEWYQGNDPEAVEVELQKLLNCYRKSPNSCRMMISSKDDKISLAIVTFLAILSELCGTTVIESYSGIILKDSINLPGVANEVALILAIVRFIAGLGSVYIVEQTGRKAILICSLGVMAVSLLCLAAVLGFRSSPNNDVWVVSSILGVYTVANQLALAAGEIVMSEIAVNGKRGMFMATGGTFKILTLIFCLQTSTFLSKWSDSANPMLQSVCCIVGFLIVLRWIPETNGKKLVVINDEGDDSVVPKRHEI